MSNFKRFGIMLDCSRNAVPTVDFLKTFITDIKKMGYNCLELYTEDTYEMDGEPNFGYLRGRFTKNELKEINAFGKEQGVELIPCIQTLAHLNCALRRYPYADFKDCNDILLVGDERTYALIDKMFATCRECFDSEYINIGMDEAHFVGLGKYLDQHGFRNRVEILLSHLEKVCKIAEKYNFKPVMWSDMFFRLAGAKGYYVDKELDIPSEVIDKVPANVGLCYWDYYHRDEKTYEAMMRSHKKFNREIWFAGGAWCWSGFTPANYASMDRNVYAMQSCRQNDIENVIITMWGDNGHETSKLAVYPALYHAARIAEGVTDMDEINEGFEKLFGLSMENYLEIEDANKSNRKPT
ncbi:MAG: beta-N-acetylhexosaminidase, partial [Clostridia bacterium]|nr:beta-N-acetylhexosaminidase [Clostridia bacterium]